jgi:hypothetical protein
MHSYSHLESLAPRDDHGLYVNTLETGSNKCIYHGAALHQTRRLRKHLPLLLRSTTVLLDPIVYYNSPLLNRPLLFSFTQSSTRSLTVMSIKIPTGSYFDKLGELALTTATSISYSLACTNGLANSTLISCKPSSQAKSAKHLTFLLVRLLRQYRSFPFFPPKTIMEYTRIC